MVAFLYDISTRVVEASGQFTILPLPPNKALVNLKDSTVLPRTKIVDQHPNPTALLDNPNYGWKIEVTLSGTTGLDFDGVPVASANGVSNVVAEICKRDKTGAALTGVDHSDTIRILTKGASSISSDQVGLKNGTAKIFCGPATLRGDCELSFIDPQQNLPAVNIKFRWR